MLEPWHDMATASYVESTDNGACLRGVRCADCGTVAFPSVTFCRRCLGESLEIELITAEGTLYAFTTIHTAGSPYTVGYIDISEELRVFGHVESTASIGDRLSLASTELPLTFAPAGGDQHNG